jgi:hypothetical protein
MGLTFTTEFPWDEEGLEQVESWCQERLQGRWRLSWHEVLDAADDDMAWPRWLHTLCVITVDTPEDHALVRLTWA